MATDSRTTMSFFSPIDISVLDSRREAEFLVSRA
jgi:hypothetical protein